MRGSVCFLEGPPRPGRRTAPTYAKSVDFANEAAGGRRDALPGPPAAVSAPRAGQSVVTGDACAVAQASVGRGPTPTDSVFRFGVPVCLPSMRAAHPPASASKKTHRFPGQVADVLRPRRNGLTTHTRRKNGGRPEKNLGGRGAGKRNFVVWEARVESLPCRPAPACPPPPAATQADGARDLPSLVLPPTSK